MKGFINLMRVRDYAPYEEMQKGEMMIEISVNGEIKEVPESLNVKEIIQALEYKTQGFAVAVNITFVAIDSYEKTIIKDGDTIDILAPVQGG